MYKSVFDYFRIIWKNPILERMLLKLTMGKKFGTIISKFPPNHYQYKQPTIRKATRGGIKFNLDISDMVEWFIYYGFKESSRQAFYKLIKPGYTVFDIGTNVGEVCMNVAKRVGEAGKVYSFEPHPTNFKRLTANLALNDFKNIHFNQLAIGDASGSLKMYTYDEGNLGMNRILSSAENKTNEVYVDVITLDSYVREKRINKIDVIKLDVEGYELKVLIGASNTLNQFHPIIFMELDNGYLSEHGDSALEVVKFLERKGYTLHHAENNSEINSKTDVSIGHYDVIGFYRDNHEAF